MQERPQNIDGMGEDPEATLVAPRFDAEEARRAHPVVPLVETNTRASFANAPVWLRRGPRRSWPTAMLAVVMLAAAAAGGALATKVLRPQASAPVQTEAAPVQTEVTPAQAEAAPAASPTGDASQPLPTKEARQSQEASPAPQAPPEEARAKQTPRESRERESEAGMLAAPAAILRRAAEDSDDKGDERRGRGKRRERGDDEAEKEMRKALKHAKGKAPRLVDVLTGP
jgi:hypothetical protein